MNPKKVLIITYYWPPAGGAGVQRWLKFVKYLPQFGWNPIIYTPENGEMPVIDHSLLKDIPQDITILKTPIWEPYEWYKKFVGAGKSEKINTGFLTEKKKPGFAEKIAVWIRGNLFIPDARRYWIKPSVKFLLDYLKTNPVDVIVSTGPPHSMHMIALKVTQQTGIKWVADFRDPWTNIDYYKDLMLSASADKLHHQMEKDVVTKADEVIVVGNTMKQEFESQFNRKIYVITNGFDTTDFPVQQSSATKDFVIAHVGTLVRTRNPLALWEAINSLGNNKDELKQHLRLRLTGKVDISVKKAIADHDLEDVTDYVDYLSHDKVVLEQMNATLLLLVLNDTPNSKGILTGKLFEYMASGRPILAIGPVDGDAAAILKESGSGVCFDFKDVNGIKNYLTEMYSMYMSGTLNRNNKSVDKWSRLELTRQLSNLLDTISHA
ncbi:MAG: Glycosyl transferases group 1 [Bacteroidetes bacterium ADurb.Bin397]|nr:MAG: Glycosyl transferases group 1 [Bacteroidetes bacterium ADurb.Bin397]